MEKDDAKKILESVISDVLDQPVLLEPDQHLNAIPGLDSVALIQVLSCLKGKYGISFSVSQIASFITVRQLTDAISIQKKI